MRSCNIRSCNIPTRLAVEELENRVVPHASGGLGLIPVELQGDIREFIGALGDLGDDGLTLDEVGGAVQDAVALFERLAAIEDSPLAECETQIAALDEAITDALEDSETPDELTLEELQGLLDEAQAVFQCFAEHLPERCQDEVENIAELLAGIEGLEPGDPEFNEKLNDLTEDLGEETGDLFECILREDRAHPNADDCPGQGQKTGHFENPNHHKNQGQGRGHCEHLVEDGEDGGTGGTTVTAKGNGKGKK